MLSLSSYIPPVAETIPNYLESATAVCCTMRMLHMVHSFDVAMKSTSMSSKGGMSWIAPFVMKFNAFLVVNVLLWILGKVFPVVSTTTAFNEQAFADFVLILLAVRLSVAKFRVVRDSVTALKSGYVATPKTWKRVVFMLTRLAYNKMFALARIMAVFALLGHLTHPFIRFVGVLTLLEFNCVFTHFVVQHKKKADRVFCRNFGESLLVALIVTLIPNLRVLIVVLMFLRHVVPAMRPFVSLLPKSKPAKKVKKN